MDDDELTTIIGTNVTGEPDSAYSGIGKLLLFIAAGVAVLIAIVGLIARFQSHGVETAIIPASKHTRAR